MEFFDKLRITLSSPLKSHSSDRDFKTWTLPAQNLKIDNIRLLLYRDCDRRGRKCLFDSAHVIKDGKTGKFTYLPVTNTGQVKDLSEWIFGCVSLSTSTKRFHRWKRNFVWSKTFQAPIPRRSTTTTTSRNIYSGSSSCLSSNGDLTSSGYLTRDSSEIDDSSYDQSSTDSCRNWSLPIMHPTASATAAASGGGGAGSTDIKMSYSLPSRLEIPGSVSKMLLGLAIVISTGNDDECDRKQLAAYISSMSETLEFATDWFSIISIQSYLNPPSFVETLYNFSEDFRQMFLTRLTIPLANINSIPSTLKYLPSSIGEFITAYMCNDLSWVKCHPSTKRCKIVIIASQKRQQEVKSIFTFLKLINQCSCAKSVPPPPCLPDPSEEEAAAATPTATMTMTVTKPTSSPSLTSSFEHVIIESGRHQLPQPSPQNNDDYTLNRHRSTLLHAGSQNFQKSNEIVMMLKNSNSSKSSPAITIHVKSDSEEESSSKDEIGVDVVAMNPEDFIKRGETINTDEVKQLTRDSTKDSGISSTLSSTTSLKRSSTSRKFLSSLSDGSSHNNNNLDTLVDYGVCFHLGEESDNEQTFNTLGLSEPNPDKLKQPQQRHTIIDTGSSSSGSSSKFDSLGSCNEGSHTSSSVGGGLSCSSISNNNDKISPALSDDDPPSETYDSFDMLEDTDLSSSSSPTAAPRDPINVELSGLPTTKLKIVKFCPYCDSISIVDKFNPLFQIQWLKLNPNSSNNNNSSGSTNSSGGPGSLDIMLGEFLNLLDESWLVYNVDKNIVKYFNASSKQESILTNPSSTLVTNLLEHVQVLMNNSRESEIEQFVTIQLEFIKKLGEDFGTRLMQVTKFDVNSMPYVSENDLGLLFSVGQWRYPQLRERFFV